MFLSDDLIKVRAKIVEKYEKKEISLGALCLIDIFLIDILANSFLKKNLLSK